MPQIQHPLDNPLWSSLTSLHEAHAVGGGDLLRYPADVAPFIATAGEELGHRTALRDLVDPNETVFSIGPKPRVPAGWQLDDLGQIVQMVYEGPSASPVDPGIVPLGERERSAVLELAALVYPHYFRSRTPELGRYFGVADGNRLIAMIGERMGMPGYREISAVCTHPDFTGRGLARRLLRFLTSDLVAHGNTPFLHVSPDNQRAIRLYQQNGYHARAHIAFASLRRP
jgi:ribosomal protein S18 acetylase RimI-like enzyme